MSQGICGEFGNIFDKNLSDVNGVGGIPYRTLGAKGDFIGRMDF